MRIPLLLFLLAIPSAHASEIDKSQEADLVTDKGTVSVEAIVKRKGSECPTNVTKACKPGKPCFANVSIEGDAAKALYLMLKTHGVKTSEIAGDYVATKSGALDCSETDGKYYCTFGYNAVDNTLTGTLYCEGE
jgi:hypothetical protein